MHMQNRDTTEDVQRTGSAPTDKQDTWERSGNNERAQPTQARAGMPLTHTHEYDESGAGGGEGGGAQGGELGFHCMRQPPRLAAV